MDRTKWITLGEQVAQKEGAGEVTEEEAASLADAMEKIAAE